jgi:hypothetical protein
MIVHVADLTLVVLVDETLGVVNRGSIVAFAYVFRAVTVSIIVGIIEIFDEMISWEATVFNTLVILMDFAVELAYRGSGLNTVGVTYAYIWITMFCGIVEVPVKQAVITDMGVMYVTFHMWDGFSIVACTYVSDTLVTAVEMKVVITGSSITFP